MVCYCEPEIKCCLKCSTLDLCWYFHIRLYCVEKLMENVCKIEQKSQLSIWFLVKNKEATIDFEVVFVFCFCFVSSAPKSWIEYLCPSSGEGNGNLQYSLLRTYDSWAWRDAVHGMARVGHDVVTKPPPLAHPHAMQWAGSVNGVQGWWGCVSGVPPLPQDLNTILLNRRVWTWTFKSQGYEFFLKRIMTLRKILKERFKFFLLGVLFMEH